MGILLLGTNAYLLMRHATIRGKHTPVPIEVKQGAGFWRQCVEFKRR